MPALPGTGGGDCRLTGGGGGGDGFLWTGGGGGPTIVACEAWCGSAIEQSAPQTSHRRTDLSNKWPHFSQYGISVYFPLQDHRPEPIMASDKKRQVFVTYFHRVRIMVASRCRH
ncbi:MAG: hypothetical protein EHM23_27945 [Acidobacteria bacterium]|nr:MAG: hypothetical protein EHM23_27945 [Acidobacteriota bacterium]